MAEQHWEFVEAGAQVLALVNDSVESARGHVEQHSVPFPCLVDRDHQVYDRYQVESKALSLGQRPGLFVIDRDGVVRYAHLGWQQWEIPNNEEVLGLCRGIPCEAPA